MRISRVVVAVSICVSIGANAEELRIPLPGLEGFYDSDKGLTVKEAEIPDTSRLRLVESATLEVVGKVDGAPGSQLGRMTTRIDGLIQNTLGTMWTAQGRLDLQGGSFSESVDLSISWSSEVRSSDARPGRRLPLKLYYSGSPKIRPDGHVGGYAGLMIDSATLVLSGRAATEPVRGDEKPVPGKVAFECNSKVFGFVVTRDGKVALFGPVMSRPPALAGRQLGNPDLAEWEMDFYYPGRKEVARIEPAQVDEMLALLSKPAGEPMEREFDGWQLSYFRCIGYLFWRYKGTYMSASRIQDPRGPRQMFGVQKRPIVRSEAEWRIYDWLTGLNRLLLDGSYRDAGSTPDPERSPRPPRRAPAERSDGPP